MKVLVEIKAAEGGEDAKLLVNTIAQAYLLRAAKTNI
jgi:protein subunit release factor A